MYYIIKPILNDDTTMIDLVSHWNYSLTLGERTPDDMPEPILFKVDTDFTSAYMPTTFLPHPVFSIDLIQALKDIGVDNFDTYDVKIINPDTDEIISGYKAVNIIGKIACANMESSNSNMIIGNQFSFKNLVIDTSKTNGVYLFRLAEWTQSILIHERIANNLPSELTKDLFFEPVAEI